MENCVSIDKKNVNINFRIVHVQYNIAESTAAVAFGREESDKLFETIECTTLHLTFHNTASLEFRCRYDQLCAIFAQFLEIREFFVKSSLKKYTISVEKINIVLDFRQHMDNVEYSR